MSKSQARQHAERFGGYTGQAWDAEDEALRAEFAGLDLTEAEQADLAEAFRLRRIGATCSEAIASRRYFDNVRRSLAAALQVTIEHETGGDRLVRSLAVFDRDEEQRVLRIEVALLRPATDAELCDMRRRLDELNATRAARRAAVAASVVAGDVSTLPKGDAVRIHARDGLAALAERRKITPRQYQAGRSYRLRWEAAFRGLRSALAGGGGASALQIARAQQRIALWEAERSKCDTAVVMRLKAHPTALVVLRRVAGDGLALTSIVGNGRSFDRGLVTLCAALDVVATILPIEER